MSLILTYLPFCHKKHMVVISWRKGNTIWSPCFLIGMTSGPVWRQLEVFAQYWLAKYVVGGGQFEQIGEDLPTTFKLQNCAVPHNKLRKHLKEVGTKLKPMLLPIPQLLKKKKKVSTLFSFESTSGTKDCHLCEHNMCWGDQNFQCIWHTKTLTTEYSIKCRNIETFIQVKWTVISSPILLLSLFCLRWVLKMHGVLCSKFF